MFKKYGSIENTYRNSIFDRIKGHGFENEKFVVQEKAHGFNISYWTNNGKEFHSTRRLENIAKDEKFYNYEVVLAEIKPQLMTMWENLKVDFPTLEQMTVFGELCGGNYPHQEVAKDQKAIITQKKIFYSPKNIFYAFDILINTETYLDVALANKHFEQVKLLHAKTLFEGTLDECVAYPNNFDTNIPQALGLPLLTPNIVEGVVIKPSKTLHFNNNIRVMLKNKNSKWVENRKYHKTIKMVEKPSEKVQKLQEAILTYITENRFNNVASKVGNATRSNPKEMLKLFNQDIVADFKKDFQELLASLEKKEVKLVTKSIAKTTVAFVEKYG